MQTYLSLPTHMHISLDLSRSLDSSVQVPLGKIGIEGHAFLPTEKNDFYAHHIWRHQICGNTSFKPPKQLLREKQLVWWNTYLSTFPEGTLTFEKTMRTSRSNQVPKVNLSGYVKVCCCDTSWISGKALCKHKQYTCAEANFTLQPPVSALGFNSHN